MGNRLILSAAIIAALSTGCAEKVLEQPQATTPPLTFQGPPFLYGTIGSMTQVRGSVPLLVSG